MKLLGKWSGEDWEITSVEGRRKREKWKVREMGMSWRKMKIRYHDAKEEVFMVKILRDTFLCFYYTFNVTQ